MRSSIAQPRRLSGGRAAGHDPDRHLLRPRPPPGARSAGQVVGAVVGLEQVRLGAGRDRRWRSSRAGGGWGCCRPGACLPSARRTRRSTVSSSLPTWNMTGSPGSSPRRAGPSAQRSDVSSSSPWVELPSMVAMASSSSTSGGRRGRPATIVHGCHSPLSPVGLDVTSRRSPTLVMRLPSRVSSIQLLCRVCQRRRVPDRRQPRHRADPRLGVAGRPDADLPPAAARVVAGGARAAAAGRDARAHDGVVPRPRPATASCSSTSASGRPAGRRPSGAGVPPGHLATTWPAPAWRPAR